jgi:hypothetical protein
MAAKQVPNDWESTFAYRPVLMESFVEKQRFKGTCYNAANWINVGQTKTWPGREIERTYQGHMASTLEKTI